VSQPGNTYDDKKLAGICTRPGCTATASPDSQLCPPHHIEAKAAKRASMKRRRSDWKRRGLCTRCGSKRSKTSRWGCPACLVATGQARSGFVDIHVDKSNRIRTDRTGRVRYHGQAERGRQPIIQLDRQDIKDAKRCIDHGEAGLGYYWSPEIQQLSRTQAAEVRAAALAKIEQAMRWLREVLVRNGRVDAPIDPADAG